MFLFKFKFTNRWFKQEPNETFQNFFTGIADDIFPISSVLYKERCFARARWSRKANCTRNPAKSRKPNNTNESLNAYKPDESYKEGPDTSKYNDRQRKSRIQISGGR